MDGGQGDSIVLEEEIDPNYEPTEDEVLEYAKWLGMDLEAERDLFWIAREGLKAPLPENWKPCKTTDTGEIYYFNFATGASTWDHPCDEYYRKLYDDHKKKTIQGKKFQDTDDKKKKEKEDIAEILGKKSKKAPKKAPKVESLSTVKAGLDKKPLGAINKLPLSGGLNALKPVATLGKPSMKAQDDSEEEEEEKTEVIKSFSRKPLGAKDKDARGAEELENKTQELSERIRQLEEEHEEKVTVLKKKLEQQENELLLEQKAIEKKLQKLQKDHADEVESVKELEKKLSKRRKDLEAEHREYIDNADSKFAEKKRELIKKQEKELKEMDEKHRETIQELDAAHENELEKQEAERRKQEMQQEHRQMEENNKIDKLNAEIETLKTEAQQYKRQVKTLEGKLREESEKPTQAPETVTELEASVESLQNQVNKLNSQLAEREKFVQALETKLKDLAKEFSEQRAEPSNLNKEIEQLEETIKSLQRQLQAEQEKVTEVDKASKSWQEKYMELASKEPSEDKNGGWHDKYLELEQKQVEDASSHKALSDKLQSKIEILESQLAERAAADPASDEWKIKYDTLSAQYTSLEATCNAAQAKNEEWSTQCVDLKAAVQEAEAKMQSLVDDKNSDNARLMGKVQEVESLIAAKESLEEKLSDMASTHTTTLRRLEEELREARNDASAWQAQYEQVLASSSQDDGIKDQIHQWQHKFEELQARNDTIMAESQKNIDKVEAKSKALEREKISAETMWKKKYDEAEESWEKQLTQAKASINELQAKWKTLQSQESSTSGIASSLQQQLEEAHRQIQESQDSLEDQQKQHKRALDNATALTKQQLEEMQTSHTAALQAVKSDLVAVESAKRKLDDQRATLERKLKQKESEIATLMTQMQDHQKMSKETSNSMWEWEKDKLTTQLRAAEAEKDEVDGRLGALRVEHDALLNTYHKIVLEKDATEKKLKQVDAEREQLGQKLKGVEKELDVVQTKWRATTTEATELKAAGNKLKLNLQTAEAQLEKAQEECRNLETLVKQQRDLAEKSQAEARALQIQLDDTLFQKQRVEHDQLTVQHEVDRLKEQLALRSSNSSLSSSAEKESLRQQIDQLSADARAANDKVRLLQGKAQEFETKFKQSQDTYDRHAATWSTEKQAAVDKLEKLRAQHHQLDRQHRTTVQEKADIEASYERLQQEKVDLEKRMKQQQDALTTAQAKISDVVHQLDDAETQKRTLGYDLQALESKFKRSEQEVERTKSELAARNQEKEALETKWRQDVAQFEVKLKSLRQDQTDQWSKRSVEEENKRDELTSQWKKDMEDKKKEWQARVSQLESENSSLQNQLTQVSKELAAAHKDVEHITTMKQKQEAQSKSMAEQIEQERNQMQESLDQMKTKLKAAQNEKDQLMMAMATNQNEQPMPPSMAPTSFDIGSTQVKLQMAQVNKTELEAHLQEVTLQCETWRRKAALLDSRSRDQALEMEALHVENAALRASAQRMHASVTESLTTIERLNYEHKKRMLRSEYMAQLREFSEREELALARQKARVRASCERQLEELVAEFERHKASRMEQEERDFQEALNHCQAENKVKLAQVLKEHRDKMASVEQEMQGKQQRHIQNLSKQMQEEEEHLAARLRDTKQLNREEDLCKVASLQPGTFESHLKFERKEVSAAPVAPVAPYQSPRARKKKSLRADHEHVWHKRIQQEQELLDKAKQFLAKQKKSLKQRMAKLQDEKDWWQRQPTYNVKARNDTRLLLEQHAQQLTHDAKVLKRTEKWMAKRELKIRKMEQACSNNNKWHEDYDEDDEPSDSSMDFVLDRLQQELLADGANMSSHLQEYAREQCAADVLPWPSESQYHQTEDIQPAPAPMYHGYPSVISNNRWLYRRQPDRVSAYESYMTPARRTPLYDMKLSNWVHNRERASAAASAHSNYLQQLSQELKSYSSKYKAEHSEGELDALP
ncbi:unnamed protein product [Aphanomyces euteiches]|uniref:WW domain-containing protein n=1 Tax=Aphanomyces euteiches TaxID=100861 RepID=A0A6G0XSA2_9STRA|nr:hypothetical protein Ae201684_001956 [Aphanomyces euteiches]KAH9087500.1 hypothetical protein Ae201684P_000904 [Aphanomyces euteiches]KAH9136908.1 hypothetical protein AeRB84_018109 [Aphanomyces euteiches]